MNEPIYWLIMWLTMAHLTGGMILLIRWPRHSQAYALVVWLGTAVVMAVLLLAWGAA